MENNNKLAGESVVSEVRDFETKIGRVRKTALGEMKMGVLKSTKVQGLWT